MIQNVLTDAALVGLVLAVKHFVAQKRGIDANTRIVAGKHAYRAVRWKKLFILLGSDDIN